MSSLFDLTGKLALLTGATHGLGMAMAEGLGNAGAKLVITGHSSQEKLDKAVASLREKGYDAHGYLFNVTDEAQVADAVGQIEGECAPIDILVNNAGIIKRTPLLEMSLEDWRQVIETDLTGVFTMTRPVAKRMIERGAGKIINICSMMSELGRDNVAAYAAAKGGLKMLTRNMATEWARYNVQVNGIGPGYFATSQTAPIRVDGHPFNEFIINRTPAGRWGNPEDLQGTAVFLASRASDFVTGQIVYVDGGILATIGKPYSD
ncbi:gluconate 5-dehydrogenase [Microbulbifer thermotolerans]|uniref:gluconate 5-dehydrogenase n=1 Tax=Microbulbifer thermotolerans TaxID=252514 RepID=UPI0008E2C393|nr:gluconate 5-dehydrogenase [Microbulbifer thermotolerans]MCX2778332.1 gluconate 5-dehydrogenase [Microbulbifer thermotolerans]MCX2783296.1 gluconate 5-dehydrogenase [Microbulbifer thermotolerans]MCX2804371.1 gluconate 5-dehydrogenase [Microbulbifer thermotolerans]MCX2832175.1 gluconate 5-dehydrogenase [Microbulbifer thermotolerans]MCX2834063.1 gluconate 5-dehydrogenase [Microbulbifer thermotolerans]